MCDGRGGAIPLLLAAVPLLACLEGCRCGGEENGGDRGDRERCAALAPAPEPGGEGRAAAPASGGGLPPLVIDASAPLLLEEPAAEPAGGAPAPAEARASASGSGPAADNEPCFVCHANFREEMLASRHAAAGTGCMDCHGESFDHRNDENNITPPDVMFPLDAIDAACGKCHEDHDAPAAKVIARWRERCPEKTDPAGIVCTHCHGGHRLAHRTVRWDRKSRELIATNSAGEDASPPKPAAAGKKP